VSRSSEDVFRELYDAYFGDVYRYVAQSVRQKDEVEDMVQDIFLQAYRNFGKFRGECGYKTWLFAIAHHSINSMWRKFFRRKKIYEQYEQEQRDREQEAQRAFDSEWERRLLHEQLLQELNRLPDHYRNVVVLRYIHEFSVADTAIIMGTSDSRVRVLTHRAILKLRENWEQGGTLYVGTTTST
jgi:RNA polymerase sigma-70 factor (ECF subfamily)